MCSYIRINYNKCIHLFPSFVTIIDFFLLPCFSPPKPGESQHDKRSSAAWLHAQSRVPAPSSDATSPSLPHSCLHALQTLTDLITPLLGNKKNVEASVLTRNKDRGCQNWVNKWKWTDGTGGWTLLTGRTEHQSMTFVCDTYPVRSEGFVSCVLNFSSSMLSPRCFLKVELEFLVNPAQSVSLILPAAFCQLEIHLSFKKTTKNHGISQFLMSSWDLLWS